MEIIVFIVIVLIILGVGALIDGVTEAVVDGVFWVLALPFRAVGKAFGKHKDKQERLPKNFLTHLPVQRVGEIFRAAFTKGDLSDFNKVMVLADDPGCFRVGVTYGENVELNFEDGSVGSATGTPRFVFEMRYEPYGRGTHGYFLWTLIPEDPDEFDDVQIAEIPTWAIGSLYEVDPNMELVNHKDAAARGLAGAAAMPLHIPGVNVNPDHLVYNVGPESAGRPDQTGPAGPPSSMGPMGPTSRHPQPMASGGIPQEMAPGQPSTAPGPVPQNPQLSPSWGPPVPGPGMPRSGMPPSGMRPQGVPQQMSRPGMSPQDLPRPMSRPGAPQPMSQPGMSQPGMSQPVRPEAGRPPQGVPLHGATQAMPMPQQGRSVGNARRNPGPPPPPPPPQAG